MIVDFLRCLWGYAKEQITREIGAIADLGEIIGSSEPAECAADLESLLATTIAITAAQIPPTSG